MTKALQHSKPIVAARLSNSSSVKITDNLVLL